MVKKQSDFEKGMIAGAKPYEEVYKKQAEALKRIETRLIDKVDSFHKKAAFLINDMNDLQRKELYGLSAPPVDLKDFEEAEEKEYVLAGLYTLAAQCRNGEPSPFQKAFIRSIQNYLGMTKLQTGIDLSKIASVDSAKTQRTIMQVFAEYLFLENEDFSFLTEYAQVFNDFSVNEKNRNDILKSIETLYKAVGAEGFIDKYGFILEMSQDGAGHKARSITLEKLTIDRPFPIPSGAEKRYEAKEIYFKANIQCQGKLVFDHCVLTYDYNTNQHQITLGETGSVEILHSAVMGTHDGEWQEKSGGYFIQPDGYCHIDPLLTVKDSVFTDCYVFAEGVKLSMENCKVQYSFLPPEKPYSRTWHFIDAVHDAESEIKNCIIENTFNWWELRRKLLELDKEVEAVKDKDAAKKIMEKKLRDLLHMPEDKFSFDAVGKAYWKTVKLSDMSHDALFYHVRIVEKTTFKNIPQGCLREVQKILNSEFFNCMCCISAGYFVNLGLISDCLFNNCEEVIHSSNGSSIQYCQFVNCKGYLLDLNSGTKVAYCEFYNVAAAEYSPQIYIHVYLNEGSTCIEHCTFDGVLYDGGRYGFIHAALYRGFKLFSDPIGVYIRNCEFRHCKTTHSEGKIIEEYDFPNRKKKVISVSDCRGLENVNKEGHRAENIRIRHETGMGEPIGARLDEKTFFP
ncbi:MAG: right-handed parallel beta-helix repeat-containing protein [Treponema sp.]|jgi:hypothetical protein|nr:right-handed parallel beta-helix repeat-containing protein [Treponema sp.]